MILHVSVFISILVAWDVFTVTSLNGCEAECSRNVHNLTPLDILSYHHFYTQLPKKAKRQWILDYLHTHSSYDDDECTTTYLIGGRNVCQKLWVATIGISKSTFYTVYKLFRNGFRKVSSFPTRLPLQKTNAAIAWMQKYFTLLGDHMPQRHIIHLPSCLSKLSVYNKMTQDLASRQKESIISKSQFFLLWDQHFSHVYIPKVKKIDKRLELICVALIRKIGSQNVTSVL